ncbi:hypothetical protein CEXT_624481, partial [Caerostris extrusa]
QSLDYVNLSLPPHPEKVTRLDHSEAQRSLSGIQLRMSALPGQHN